MFVWVRVYSHNGRTGVLVYSSEELADADAEFGGIVVRRKVDGAR